MDKPLVDSQFGKVKAGSFLSYHHPPLFPHGKMIHYDAPPYPKLPLDDYHITPIDCNFVPTSQEQLHLHSLSVTLSQSRQIEASTKGQSAAPEWHLLRKERVTPSHFREVCHVQGDKSADNLAERIIQEVRTASHMKRGVLKETELCST